MPFGLEEAAFYFLKKNNGSENLREGHVIEINKILELMVQSPSSATSQSQTLKKYPMVENYCLNEIHVTVKYSH